MIDQLFSGRIQQFRQFCTHLPLVWHSNCNYFILHLASNPFILFIGIYIYYFYINYSRNIRNLRKIEVQWKLPLATLYIWISRIFTDWISNLSFHWFISEKIFFTAKSVNFHWLNQWKKYFLLLNQLISTEVISEIWLIYSNLFLAIWISQISLIISRFWLIQI